MYFYKTATTHNNKEIIGNVFKYKLRNNYLLIHFD